MECRIFGGVEIAEGISDINRSFQIVIPNDLADIVGFGIAGVSRTKMSLRSKSQEPLVSKKTSDITRWQLLTMNRR